MGSGHPTPFFFLRRPPYKILRNHRNPLKRPYTKERNPLEEIRKDRNPLKKALHKAEESLRKALKQGQECPSKTKPLK